jgi:xylulokinase
MMLMYGSTIFTIGIGSERIRDPRLWHAPWLFADQYASMAGLATSGTLTHWFADQLARDLSPEATMGALAAEALSSPPGANGLVFLPYFSGERTPIHDPNAKGAIVGLTLAHTRADIYRAALEGIAFATKHIFDTYAEVGAPPSKVVAVGGGLRNRIWTQATSDVSGLKQEAREISIGASYGDAFLARLGLGDVSKSAIKQWNPAAFTIEPDRRSTCLYKRRYATFRELYTRIRDVMAELGASDEDSGAE